MLSYKDLSESDHSALLKFPVYVSLLAANYHSHGIDEKEKKAAIEFAHIKTFKCNPLLKDFFVDAEKVFEPTLSSLNEQLPKTKKEREAVIRNELEKLEKLVRDLGTEFSSALHESMKEYKEHVAKAHHSLLEYLLFPIPIKGLTA